MDDPLEPAEPASLRRLRRMVTVLMGVMIFGVITVVALLVIRLTTTPSPVVPEGLALPGDAVAEAVTVSRTRVLVVTQAGQLLIFERETGRLTEEIPLKP